jgi:NAD(P)H-nitrite reductase large subunit
VLAVGEGWTSWLTADTVVCRCEEVTLATVDEAIERRGARDLRSVKLTTRCGMGHCQGRICAPTVAGLVAARTGHAPADAGTLDRRPVLHPVPLGRL